MIPTFNGDSEQFFTDCSEYLSLVSEFNSEDSQIVRALQNIVAMRDESAAELNALMLQDIAHIEPEMPEVWEYPDTLLGRTLNATEQCVAGLSRFVAKVASFVSPDE